MGAAAPYSCLGEVTHALQKEGPPQNGHVEELAMSWLDSTVDHDVFIGILPRDSPVCSNVREAYEQLPLQSIVRQIAANFTQAVYGHMPENEQEEMSNIFGDMTLEILWDFTLNPRILMPTLPPNV